MGYLGLDQTEIKDDNLLQRMFWPSDHPGESDTLGQQGFWVCLIIAVLSAVLLLLHGAWLSALIALFVYAVAGVGVREHSQPAAILIATVYILEEAFKFFAAGIWPGTLDLIISLLLLANVRGTWVAAKWAASGPPDIMPDRLNSTFTDKLVDQMPPRVWPVARIPFFIVTGLYLLLTLFGTVFVAARTGPQPAPQPPSATLQVAPSR